MLSIDVCEEVLLRSKDVGQRQGSNDVGLWFGLVGLVWFGSLVERVVKVEEAGDEKGHTMGVSVSKYFTW